MAAIQLLVSSPVTCPTRSAPQHLTERSTIRAQPNPLPPISTDVAVVASVNPSMPTTETGLYRSVVVSVLPSPSRRFALLPQHFTVPSTNKTHTDSKPTLTSETGVEPSPDTVLGPALPLPSAV